LPLDLYFARMIADPQTGFEPLIFHTIDPQRPLVHAAGSLGKRRSEAQRTIDWRIITLFFKELNFRLGNQRTEFN